MTARSLCTPNPRGKLRSSAEPVLELLKVFSHDCRSDLVSMGAALALLEKGCYGALSGASKEEIHKVFQRVGKMIGMLEDAIAHTAARESKLHLQTEPVNLVEDILEPLFQELCYAIPRERILVTYHPPELFDEITFQIQGNRFLLKSVFRNLLKNAAAYGTKQGKIILRITRMGRYVIVDVCNQGQPLPDELRKDLFSQSKGPENPLHRGKQGLGIGLSLVKQIVENHGGRIWYRGEKNASHFLFSLPTIRKPH
jgi:two-component system CheB/CheR fusion protein